MEWPVFLLQGTRAVFIDEYPQLGEYGPQAQPIMPAAESGTDWGADIVRTAANARASERQTVRRRRHDHPDLDIVIDFWSRAGIPQLLPPFLGAARNAPDLIAVGHEVENGAFMFAYYVTGGNIPATLAMTFGAQHFSWTAPV